MAVQAHRPTLYALLVGIDDYPTEWAAPLDSCARDVTEIKKCLENISTVTLDTTILVAAAENNTAGSPNPSMHLEGRPSYDNIASALCQIIMRANEGDSVYIHYSGHGTRVPPNRSPYSNHNVGDLAWVVLQDSRIRYFHGIHLAQQIKRMVEKGLRVTLVLDCCHAGSVMRDDDDSAVRYLEYNVAVDAAFPPVPDKEEGTSNHSSATGPLPEPHPGTYREVSMYPNWMIDPKGFYVIAACGPHEIARHYPLKSAVQYGALSYFLIEALRDSSSGTFLGQFDDIYQRLRIRFLQSFSEQNPMWYGNKHQELFGAASQHRGPLYPVIQKGEDHFQLEGGQAHGICVGDKLELLDVGCIATVVKVRGLTSDLKVGTLLNISRAKGWPARALTHLALQRYPMRLVLGPDDRHISLTDIRNKRPWLQIAFNENELRTQPFFKVNPVSAPCPAGYELRDASNKAFKYVDAELSNLDHTLEAIEHIAKFHLFNELSNDAFPALSCNARLADGKTGKEFALNTLTKAVHNDRLSLIIENNGSDVLYIHVYSLLPYWEVQNIVKGGYEVLLPKKRNFPTDRSAAHIKQFGRRGMISRKIGVEIPKELIEQGEHDCVDIIKVLITKRPTSFETWTLPKVNNIANYGTPALRGGEEKDTSGLEHWEVFTFPIHVCQDGAVGATTSST
ncbi:caspase domain-containing protein [Nemania serpens]|nr:caspase domain-containing protein [Nemania serpens]